MQAELFRENVHVCVHVYVQAPARAYRRAFGVMFLDRTFRPQQNKVRIVCR
jgi:hypothetical protein